MHVLRARMNNGYSLGELPVRTGPIPLSVLLLIGALWIVAVIPQGFKLPWSNVSFASSYGGALLFCYFLTALTTMKALQIRLKQRNARECYGERMPVSHCSTCQTFSEVTNGFIDVSPKVEAVYIEHLKREHEIEP